MEFTIDVIASLGKVEVSIGNSRAATTENGAAIV